MGQVERAGAELYPEPSWGPLVLWRIDIEALIPQEALELAARDIVRRDELEAVDEVVDRAQPLEWLGLAALQAGGHDLAPRDEEVLVALDQGFDGRPVAGPPLLQRDRGIDRSRLRSPTLDPPSDGLLESGLFLRLAL